MVHLAGHAVAEWKCFGDSRSLAERIEENPEYGDFRQAFALLRKFEGGKRRLRKWLQGLAQKTETIVRRPDISAAIALVAEALLNKPTLHEDELVDLLLAVPAEGYLCLANPVDEP